MMIILIVLVMVHVVVGTSHGMIARKKRETHHAFNSSSVFDGYFTQTLNLWDDVIHIHNIFLQ